MLTKSGQTLIEVIIAMAILVIIASASTIAILGSFSTTRLGKEKSIATALSVEGIEATRSIQNGDWDALIDGDHGLDNSSGSWSFSGTSDVDPTGRFTRVVTVAPVLRTGSGNIIISGGSEDNETKFVTSTVSWNFTDTRVNSASVSAYLTNWQEGKFGEQPVVDATTCGDVCIILGFNAGICRSSTGQCNQNNESREGDGDQFCTVGSQDTCCCQPI